MTTHFISNPASRSMIATHRRIKHSSNRSGTAAVELAIALPVLFVVAFGCVDLGSAISDSIVLSSAVRRGAEYGATTQFSDYTNDSWEGEIESLVADEMQDVRDFAAENLTITVATDLDADGSVRVTVDASYPYTPITNWPGLPQSFVLHRSVSMRQYQ